MVYDNDGGEVCLGDQIADKNKEDELENHMVLKKLLQELPEKDKSIISMRYFGNKTQSQVAEMMGISQVQVSRLEKKILLRLREKMEI